MGTKNQPGKYDCYHAAKDDEPMFVLLARDPIAPVLVQLWANILLAANPEDTDKAQEAINCAAEMRYWKKYND